MKNEEMEMKVIAIEVENQEEPNGQVVDQAAEPNGGMGAGIRWLMRPRVWMTIAGVVAVALVFGAIIYRFIDINYHSYDRDRRGLIPEDAANPNEDSEFIPVVFDD